jgi:hypothetical protein
LETVLQLRLLVAVGAKPRALSEIRCKGAVVRVEQRDVPQTSIALAVAIRDYRIVREDVLGEAPRLCVNA